MKRMTIPYHRKVQDNQQDSDEDGQEREQEMRLWLRPEATRHLHDNEGAVALLVCQ